MKCLDTISELRSALAEDRRKGRTIGFVPTMGALHAGHRSLIQTARTECDPVVVSIFVNPTQFGPGEDFEAYPRPLEADLAVCAAEGVDLVFAPAAGEIYPANPATVVTVKHLTETLCGAHRPGHFDGVTTVVAKLFNIVQPDIAYFGQKDAQQAVVIRKMVVDLNMPLEIRVGPTIREPDGLALSSRNAYLSPQEREQALSLSRSLRWAEQAIQNDHRDPQILVQQMRERIEAAGPCEIDYIAIVDADSLTLKTEVNGRCLIALAVRIGRTRLIDNIVVNEQ